MHNAAAPSPPLPPVDSADALEEARESPHHGFRGDASPGGLALTIPPALSVAVSREAGSRGGSIARRAGRKLGWQVYNQELLEYIAQEGAFRRDMTDTLSGSAARWVEERLHVLVREHHLDAHPSLADVARVVLSLGAQ